MPIQRIPGPWDYLAEGLSQGQQSYNTQHDRRMQEAQLALQNKMQQLGFLTNLYGAGGIDSGALTGAMGGVPGMGGINVAPSPAELRRKILAQPGGLESATPEQRMGAGLPQTYEEAPKKLAGAQAESQLPNVSADEIARQQAQVSTLLRDQAPGYVAGIAGRMGSITKDNFQQIADHAFEQWKQARAASGMPAISDELFARSYFNDAAMELLLKQEDQRIRMTAAMTGHVTPQDRTIQYLLTLREQIRNEKNNLYNAAPGFQYGTPPRPGEPDIFGQVRTRFGELEKTDQAIIKALADVMRGKNVDISGITIGADGGMTQQGGTTPQTSRATFDKDQLKAVAERLTAYTPEDRVAKINGWVSTGRMSLADAKSVAQMAGVDASKIVAGGTK